MEGIQIFLGVLGEGAFGFGALAVFISAALAFVLVFSGCWIPEPAHTTEELSGQPLAASRNIAVLLMLRCHFAALVIVVLIVIGSFSCKVTFSDKVTRVVDDAVAKEARLQLNHLYSAESQHEPEA